MNRELDEIIRLMDRAHGRDISVYDEGFLMRSLGRRVSASGCETLAAYLGVLSEDSAEVEAVHRSLCVSYSEFFRNPLSFALLEQLVLPGLIAEKERAAWTETRVWSAGHSAGAVRRLGHNPSRCRHAGHGWIQSVPEAEGRGVAPTDSGGFSDRPEGGHEALGSHIAGEHSDRVNARRRDPCGERTGNKAKRSRSCFPLCR